MDQPRRTRRARSRGAVAGLALCAGWLLAGAATAGDAAEPERPPNILFILIDDLGWMDLGCQGNAAVRTPHVDRLARGGMRFTSAYAAAPVCSPTRAALLTGLAPARLRITNHTPERKSFIPDDPQLLPAPMFNFLSADRVTVAERLKAAGYDTAFLGKWHLSGPGRGRAELEPTAQGFDINIGGCGFGGPPTFFDPYQIPNLPDRRAGEYLPERLADEAIAFIKQPREAPFLLMLWNYTVHWPMEAPAPLLDKYADHQGPGLNDPRYGAMIEGMDLAVGRVLRQLERQGIADETLVVFTSDNGGFSGVADNRPLRGGKGDLYEGGLRVPLIVSWPGVVEPASVCETPVISMDFYPTLLEAAGVDSGRGPRPEGAEGAEGSDGVSLLPLLRGAGGPSTERPLFFHYPNYAWHRSNRLGGAVRQGPWKLIERFDNGELELFRMDEDLSEKRSLAAERADVARRLAGRLARWRGDVDAAMPRRP